MQNCVSCTALTGSVVGTAEVRGYSLFDSKGTERMLASFKSAWDTFEEMNKNGNNYDFTGTCIIKPI